MNMKSKPSYKDVLHRARNGYWVNIYGVYQDEIEAIHVGLRGGFIKDDRDLELLNELGFDIDDQ